MKIQRVLIFILIIIVLLIGISLFNQTKGADDDQYYIGYTEGPTCGHDGGFYYEKAIGCTCITWGKHIYRCSQATCNGYKVVYAVEPKKHLIVGKGTITEVPPTCTNEGYTEYKCIWCHYYETTNKVPALGHDDEPVVVEPTCLLFGYKESGCRRCKKDYSYEVTPALGHDWDREYYIEPTCKTMGFKGLGCRRCGEIVTPDQDGGSEWIYIDSRNHVWDEDKPIVVKKATCVDKGKEKYICTLCGRESEEMTTGIDEDNHDYPKKPSYHVKVTCETDGKDVYVCKRKGCGAELPEITEEKYGLPHDYDITKEIKASCTVDGKTIETCKKCGDVKETPIKATGHKENKNTGKCSICGEELDWSMEDED